MNLNKQKTKQQKIKYTKHSISSFCKTYEKPFNDPW